MTPSRAITALAIAFILGAAAFVYVAKISTPGQDASAWCGTAWPCDAAGPPAAGKTGPVDRFVAIAVSDKSSVVGIATDRKSKDEAVKLALSNCAANSNNDHCELVQWAGNGCLAIAVSQPDASFGAATLADSRLGAWVQAMTNCRKANAPNCAIVSTPCASDDPRLSTPFPPPPNASGDTVDPATVGTWEAPMNPGRWVWEIAPNGAYEFHTEAPDGAPSHAGGFASANGKWKLQSNVGYSDSDDGTYQMQGPDAMAMSGKLGLGTWHRIKK